jgi:hypothetical protein
MLDGDLQDPPELILAMLDRWREGADVGRIYDEVKGRPLYVVRSRVNVVAPSADELDRVTLP